MNDLSNGQIDPGRIVLRTFEPKDQAAVNWLYEHGLLEGQPADNDTGADIENITEAYLTGDRAHFWVAEVDGEVVGMVGLAEDEPNIAEIRRLRVKPELHTQGIATRLMEMALAFCRHHGFLKVRLDTRLQPGHAAELFERFAFQHHRTKEVPGKELLEYYLDLYREPRNEE